MALSIDGFEVLRAMAMHSSSFPDIAGDLNKSLDALGKAARVLVIKQVKHKNTNLQKIRAVLDAIGPSNFKLVIDGIPDAQIKILVGKLDYHPEIKTETAQWRRQHLISLIDGSKELTPKAAPIKSSARTGTSKKSSTRKVKSHASGEPETLDYSSAGAQRKR
jgi:hypothetical protein